MAQVVHPMYSSNLSMIVSWLPCCFFAKHPKTVLPATISFYHLTTHGFRGAMFFCHSTLAFPIGVLANGILKTEPTLGNSAIYLIMLLTLCNAPFQHFNSTRLSPPPPPLRSLRVPPPAPQAEPRRAAARRPRAVPPRIPRSPEEFDGFHGAGLGGMDHMGRVAKNMYR